MACAGGPSEWLLGRARPFSVARKCCGGEDYGSLRPAKVKLLVKKKCSGTPVAYTVPCFSVSEVDLRKHLTVYAVLRATAIRTPSVIVFGNFPTPDGCNHKYCTLKVDASQQRQKVQLYSVDAINWPHCMNPYDWEHLWHDHIKVPGYMSNANTNAASDWLMAREIIESIYGVHIVPRQCPIAFSP